MVLPPSPAKATPDSDVEREEPRDTLAPSSFGNLGARPNNSAAPAPTGLRSARAPMPTLGELEGASATATLRPPGAVPPPPRALPTATPTPDLTTLERSAALETPLPGAGAAGTLAPVEPLERTLDMSGSASKKATQAALIEQTRSAEPSARTSVVPPPGLYIADEPLERRPQQASLVTVQRRELSRMRAGLLLLAGLLLMAAGALVVLIFRRTEASAQRQAVASAVSAARAPTPPRCALLAPPSRISPVERAVPLDVQALPDGNITLALAETKTSAATFLYRPSSGDAERKASVPGATEVTHVSADNPPVVDRASPDFSFAHTLAPGLELGVGPSGVLRRGADGATGVVWPLPAGVRVTPPRVAALPSGHFVTFRRGGAEGQIMSGWLRPDGSAATPLTALADLPKNLGTPTAARLGEHALVLFSARADKAEPYRIYAATAAAGQAASASRALDAPGEGGGAIAPSLAALSQGRYLLQWTDGNVGQYQVQARILDAELSPLSPPLRISAKGANAGQGLVASTARAAVSFFIQTTAGHDELWGVALSCH